MKYTQSYLNKNRGVYDRHTGKTVKSVVSPPSVLKNFKFWAYDPKMGEGITDAEEAPYRLANTHDLINYHEEDLHVLSKNQIQTNEKYEICAKSWTGAIANVLAGKLVVNSVPDCREDVAGGASR
ncbi:hypothetical protein Hanom_Chr12g01089801 [Helianthus anomalus]